MTRNELVKAIFDSSYCPVKRCGLLEAEGFTGECCLKCVNEQLKEYEQTIRNKAIDECIEALKKKRDKRYLKVNCDDLELRILAEQLKGGAENE